MDPSSSLAHEQEFLRAKSKELHLVQFWSEREEIENLVPRRVPVPYIWHWHDMRPQLDWAGRALGVEDAERRALLFANPGLGGKYHATHTLLGAFSLYNVGETAPVHRHTPCASRFAISGQGGYTTVNGEKCAMGRGDLILTPAGLWHDHGNDGPDPLIWMDVLDLPYVESLNCSYFEFDYFEEVAQSNSTDDAKRTTQSIRYPAGYSEQVYGHGGIVPLFGDEGRGQGRHSPKYHYPWAATREALHAMKGHEGSPYDGIIVEYCDPSTGRSGHAEHVVPRPDAARGRGDAALSRYDKRHLLRDRGQGPHGDRRRQARLGGERRFRRPQLDVAPARQRFAGRRGSALFRHRSADHPAQRVVPPAVQDRRRRDRGPRTVLEAGRGERIRTSDIQLPKLALYQAELRPGRLQSMDFHAERQRAMILCAGHRKA